MSTSPGTSPERPDTTGESETPAPADSDVDPVEPEHAEFLETPSSHDVAVRRAPKYQTFLLIGVVVGLIAAMVLTFAFQRSPEEIDPAAGEVYFSPGTVFGFLLLLCIPIGIALFGLLAWIIDVSARKKARTVRVDKLDVRVAESSAPQGENTAHDDSRSTSAPHEGDDR